MSRRSLIICFSALAAMVVMIVAAVAFLYNDDEGHAPVASRYALAHAVPPNAVMVCFLSEASEISSPLISSFGFPKELSEFFASGNSKGIAGRPMALSMHYSGSLAPLYVFDAGAASSSASADAALLLDFVRQRGFQAEHVNCAELAPAGPLASRSLVLVAKTKVQISISKSHIKEGKSLMDAVGFIPAAQDAPEDVMFFPYEHAKILFEKAASKALFKKCYPAKDVSEQYSAVAGFFKSLSGWAALSLERDKEIECIQHYSEGSDFMSVMNHGAPGVSSLSSVLPSNTCFALSLPMEDAGKYIAAYSLYLDSSKKKISVQKTQSTLRKNTGIAPDRFFKRLAPKEVASALFMCGDKMERVNLVKVSKADTVLLRRTGDSVLSGSPKVRPYAFEGYVASVFGQYFKLKDESSFTYMDGWLITGSERAVEEYVKGWALEYPLRTYMADAGQGDLLAAKAASCVVYLNMPQGSTYLADALNKEMRVLHDVFKGDAEYSPIVMMVFSKGGRMHTDLKSYQLDMKRSRAPKHERDTVVTVPSGPFKVVNSGTGRTNLFYQQSNGAICLQEENGRGIWGVPFKHKLCGTAHNIDYFANGNKQILFGAGSSLYMIDRHGRFVGGFPTDLGKEILIGPDVYDFNGTNAYNVLVLHKDNTVEMYDLKGKKPDSWKGISSDEKIKSLPEMIIVGENTFWVVRTSMQVLIYPFYGGKPLNSFKGDSMFMPDAEVKVRNSTTVEARCYDGKVRTVKVK